MQLGSAVDVINVRVYIRHLIIHNSIFSDDVRLKLSSLYIDNKLLDGT